ncbi:MAG: 3-keto-disaccharide hydrolase [Limisphaerales bacterium]
MKVLPIGVLTLGIVFLSGCATTEITTSQTETTYLKAPKSAEIDFTPLFDGHSLKGWKLLGKKGAGFGVHDGVLFCTEGGGGKLLTEKQYANFILRFEFRLSEGANNGVAIRAPLTDKALAYDGMELQILDDSVPPKKTIRPTQYHGSIYDVVPARRGALNPANQWNEQEVIANGRNIRVAVNGKVILDVDLNSIRDPKVIQKHPGLFKERGHLGFMGHNDFCEFRNIRVKELPNPRVVNRSEDGFDLLFDGRRLENWRGASVGGRVFTEKAQQVDAQVAELHMNTHWFIASGAMHRDSAAADVMSLANYRDVELSLEYKVAAGATGGVLLRGVPQVLIQDRESTGNDLRLGSGGLHDGRFLYRAPTAYADRFAGAWNRMRVILAGGNAHVFVNDRLVVKNKPFKNPDQPGASLPALGPIGLASGEGEVSFRSICARGIDTRAVVKRKPKAKQTEPAKVETKTPPATKPVTPTQPIQHPVPPKQPDQPKVIPAMKLKEAR